MTDRRWMRFAVSTTACVFGMACSSADGRNGTAGERSASKDSGAAVIPSGPMPLPPTVPGALDGTSPAAPVHWRISMVESLLNSGGFGPVHRLPAAELSGVNLPDIIGKAPLRIVLDVRGERVLAAEMGDGIVATEVADVVRTLNPGALVFTSNNLVVVARAPTPLLRELRDSLTTIHIRSGRR